MLDLKFIPLRSDVTSELRGIALQNFNKVGHAR